LIRTVLGDVPAGDLGVCDAHDHLFFRSAQLPGQELADADAAVGELRAFAALGGRAVVQWAPFGLGRRADQRTGGSEVLHRQPSPRLQLGLNAPA
jgi:phosphotriesterase-related protein